MQFGINETEKTQDYFKIFNESLNKNINIQTYTYHNNNIYI